MLIVNAFSAFISVHLIVDNKVFMTLVILGLITVLNILDILLHKGVINIISVASYFAMLFIVMFGGMKERVFRHDIRHSRDANALDLTVSKVEPSYQGTRLLASSIINKKHQTFMLTKKGTHFCDSPIQPGARIRYTGAIEKLKPKLGYGDFDGLLWGRVRGVQGHIRIKDWSKLEVYKNSSQHFSYLVQCRLKRILDKHASSKRLRQSAAIIRSLFLGDTSDLSQETRDIFFRTGTVHLIAVSGFQVGFVILCIRFMLKIFNGAMIILARRRQGGHRRLEWSLLLMGIWGYAYCCQMQAAVVRATLFFTIYLTAQLLGTKHRAIEYLTVTFILLMCVDPFCVFDIGLLLSISGVCGLLLCSERQPLLQQILLNTPNKVGRFTKWLNTILNYSLSMITTSLLTTGLIAATFNLQVPLSPLCNALLCWLVALIQLPIMMVAGTSLIFDSSLVFRVGTRFGEIFLYAVEQCDIYLGVVRYCFGYSLIVTVVLSILTYLLLDYQRRKIARLIIGTFIYILWSGQPFAAQIKSVPWEGPQLAAIRFLSVGQGDCVVIEDRFGHMIVIDTGPPYRQKNVAAHLERLLNSDMKRSIDLLIVTHPDSDHVGGLQRLLDTFDIKRLWLGGKDIREKYARELNSAYLQKTEVAFKKDVESYFGLGEVKIRPLVPFFPGNIFDAPELGQNDNSLAVEVQIGEARILFPGDIEHFSEQYLVEAGRLREVDILLAPHHGSQTSSTNAFIDATRPKDVIFSAGFQNRFGFPKLDIVNRYKSVRSNIWSTNCHGTTSIVINRNGYKISGFTSKTSQYLNPDCRRLSD